MSVQYNKDFGRQTLELVLDKLQIRIVYNVSTCTDRHSKDRQLDTCIAKLWWRTQKNCSNSVVHLTVGHLRQSETNTFMVCPVQSHIYSAWCWDAKLMHWVIKQHRCGIFSYHCNWHHGWDSQSKMISFHCQKPMHDFVC